MLNPHTSPPKTTVCFLSQYFAPETGATSELVSKIARELAEKGYNVEAIAGQPTYHGKSKLPKNMNVDGIHVTRVSSTRLDRNTVIGRVLNSATFAVSSLVKCLGLPDDRVVVCLTNPPILPWVTWICSIVRKTPYVITVHDIYPHVAVRLGLLKEHSLTASLWRRLNRIAFQRASRVIVLGRDAQSAVRNEIRREDRERVVIIPNWADGAAVIPTKKEQNPLLEALGIRDRFVVQYSGNLGRFHELETVLQCAEMLRGDSFYFLFIGSGAQEGLLKQHIDRGNAGNMQLLPYQPRSHLNVSLTACDVGLVTLRDGMTGLAVPSKLYGILAAGKPVVVIGPEDSEPAMVVRENHCGIVVRPGDPEGLANALRRLKDDGELRADMGRKGRKAFERSYDLPVVVAQWKGLLQDVIENGNGESPMVPSHPKVSDPPGAGEA